MQKLFLYDYSYEKITFSVHFDSTLVDESSERVIKCEAGPSGITDVLKSADVEMIRPRRWSLVDRREYFIQRMKYIVEILENNDNNVVNHLLSKIDQSDSVDTFLEDMLEEEVMRRIKVTL